MFNFPSINVSTLKQLFKNVDCSVSQYGITAPKESYGAVIKVLRENKISWNETSDSWGTDFNITSDIL